MNPDGVTNPCRFPAGIFYWNALSACAQKRINEIILNAAAGRLTSSLVTFFVLATAAGILKGSAVVADPFSFMAVLGRNNGLLSSQHQGTDQRHDQANGQYLEVREQYNDHRVLVHLLEFGHLFYLLIDRSLAGASST